MISDKDIELLSQKLTFWDTLHQSQKDILISTAKEMTITKGHSFCCRKDEPIGVIVIKSGTIRTFITSDEGREITLLCLDAGDVSIISTPRILTDIEMDITMETETECRIIQINPAAFTQIYKENIQAELFCYKIATKRFSDVMWVMQQILFTSFAKRLASFLIEESNKTGSATIHMTHEQIARYLGTAREVVSRMLKYFSTEGYVRLSRGDITILDMEKLAKTR